MKAGKLANTTKEAPSVNELELENRRLLTENVNLKCKIVSKQVTPESFEGNDDKVKFLTGLPSFLTLMAIFQFLAPSLNGRIPLTLNGVERYILVLLKLRLNMPGQELAYKFGISNSSVSNYFLKTVHVMYMKLRKLIVWPDREALRKTMPMEIRKHFHLKVAVIIDCFEIFIIRSMGW